MGPTEAEAASNIIHIAYSRVIINNRATTPRLGSESPWGHTGVGRLVTSPLQQDPKKSIGIVIPKSRGQYSKIELG